MKHTQDTILNVFHSFHLCFGRYYGSKILFWDLLTFRSLRWCEDASQSNQFQSGSDESRSMCKKRTDAITQSKCPTDFHASPLCCTLFHTQSKYSVLQSETFFFWPQKRIKRPQKLLIIGPPTFLCTGPAAQMTPKQKSRTTKSPLVQDWVFRLGFHWHQLPMHPPTVLLLLVGCRKPFHKNYWWCVSSTLDFFENRFFPAIILHGALGNRRKKGKLLHPQKLVYCMNDCSNLMLEVFVPS